jgi:predicted nuclease of predicted toxin-antitoxin system
MAQAKILLDSNSYFRLAQNIHPLLFQQFGQPQYTLYVHGDLMKEFKRSSRLQNKFHWVTEPEFVENRKRPLMLGNANKEAIEATFEYMWEHVKDEGLGPSQVDVKILATAAEIEIPVVTDDKDMKSLAELYVVKNLGTMDLMKMMLDAEHIQIDIIKRVVSQWIYDNDTPYRGYEKDYLRLFRENPPKGE